MINKSIAVIINGCLRDESNNILEDFTLYKKVIEEIKSDLKDFETVHIYYHTWNTFQKTDVLSKKYAYNKEKFINEFESITYKLIIEDQYTQDELRGYTLSKSDLSYKYDCRYMFNCFKSYKTLCYNIKKSNNTYDYILRTRNDLIVKFEDFKEIINKSDNDYICIPPIFWCPPEYINDHWVFGKSELIHMMFNQYSLDDLKMIVKNSWNWEEVFKKHIHNPIYIAPVSYYKVRERLLKD
jgi:hypothetical protein